MARERIHKVKRLEMRGILPYLRQVGTITERPSGSLPRLGHTSVLFVLKDMRGKVVDTKTETYEKSFSGIREQSKTRRELSKQLRDLDR